VAFVSWDKSELSTAKFLPEFFGFWYNYFMNCRSGCAACCIAMSISSPMPGLPKGKPAGLPCPHLNTQNLCQLYDSPLRPSVCKALTPNHEMCGNNRDEALLWLAALEEATAPTNNVLPTERNHHPQQPLFD